MSEASEERGKRSRPEGGPSPGSLRGVSMDVEEFAGNFPHLARDLGVAEREDERLLMERVERGYDPLDEPALLEGYRPNVFDYIRRCDNEAQALAIVDFLERRNEISHGLAEGIRRKLCEKGVRHFGPKKEDDYYVRRYYRPED